MQIDFALASQLRPNPEPLWSRIEASAAPDHAAPRALDGRWRKNTPCVWLFGYSAGWRFRCGMLASPLVLTARLRRLVV